MDSATPWIVLLAGGVVVMIRWRLVLAFLPFNGLLLEDQMYIDLAVKSKLQEPAWCMPWQDATTARVKRVRNAWKGRLWRPLPSTMRASRIVGAWMPQSPRLIKQKYLKWFWMPCDFDWQQGACSWPVDLQRSVAVLPRLFITSDTDTTSKICSEHSTLSCMHSRSCPGSRGDLPVRNAYPAQIIAPDVKHWVRADAIPRCAIKASVWVPALGESGKPLSCWAPHKV